MWDSPGRAGIPRVDTPYPPPRTHTGNTHNSWRTMTRGGKTCGPSGHSMNVVQRGALTAVAEIDGVDERAVRFEAVFAACSKVVFAYARRRATREEAEDVVSETFLVAWRRFDELPSDPLPWLIGA